MRAWYPEPVPGSHHGAWAASRDVHSSQLARSSAASGSSHPLRPAVCPMTWRTSTFSLPLAANSGQ